MTYFNSLKVAIDSSVIENDFSIISVSVKFCLEPPSQIDFDPFLKVKELPNLRGGGRGAIWAKGQRVFFSGKSSLTQPQIPQRGRERGRTRTWCPQQPCH